MIRVARLLVGCVLLAIAAAMAATAKAQAPEALRDALLWLSRIGLTDLGERRIRGFNEFEIALHVRFGRLDLTRIKPRDFRPEDLKHLAAFPNLVSLEVEGAILSDVTAPMIARLKLRVLDAQEPTITDQGLAAFRDHPTLEHIELRRAPRIAGPGLAAMRSIPQLANLSLYETTISQEGVAALAGHPKVAKLTLSNVVLGPAAWRAFATLPSLRELRCSRCSLGQAGVESVAELPALETLSLWLSREVRGADLRLIARIASLRNLSLQDAHGFNAEIDAMAALPNLHELTIRSPDFNDDGGERLALLNSVHDLTFPVPIKVGSRPAAAIASLPPLDALTMQESGLTDSGFALISRIATLLKLNLNYSAIGDQGLVHLAGHARLADLQVAKTRVSDASIPLMAALPALKSVYLDQSRVTRAGYERLEKLRPDVRVTGVR